MLRFTTDVQVNPALDPEDFYEPDEMEQFQISGANLTTVTITLWDNDDLPIDSRTVDGLPDNNPALIDYVLHDLADAICEDYLNAERDELNEALSEVLIRA